MQVWNWAFINKQGPFITSERVVYRLGHYNKSFAGHSFIQRRQQKLSFSWLLLQLSRVFRLALQRTPKCLKVC